MTQSLNENHEIFFDRLFDAEKNGTLADIPLFSEVKKWRAEYPDYPYLDTVTGWIAEKMGLTLTEEEKNNFKSLCYYAGASVRNDKQKEYERKMFADGYLKLTEDVVKQAIEENKKIHLKASVTNDWLSCAIDKVYKPHCFNGRYGLMNTKARSRGYTLGQFENAFCKLI